MRDFRERGRRRKQREGNRRRGRRSHDGEESCDQKKPQVKKGSYSWGMC